MHASCAAEENNDLNKNKKKYPSTIHIVRKEGQSYSTYCFNLFFGKESGNIRLGSSCRFFDHRLEQMCNNLWSQVNYLFHDEIKWHENLTRHTSWDVLQHWEDFFIGPLRKPSAYKKGRSLLEKVRRWEDKPHPYRLTKSSHWFSCGKACCTEVWDFLSTTADTWC